MQFQKAVRPLRGEISVPGDKSISHRAVMFGAISEGTTAVSYTHLTLPTKLEV